MALKIRQVEERTSDLSKVELIGDARVHVKLRLTFGTDAPQGIEIDLTEEEGQTLKDVLAPYFAAVTVATGKPEDDPSINTPARRWAEQVTKEGNYLYNGKELERPSKRGRLSTEWKAAYLARNDQPVNGDQPQHASEEAINAAMDAGEQFAEAEAAKAGKGK